MLWTVSALSAATLTGALAWPLLALPAENRAGTSAAALAALDGGTLESYPIAVSEYAPLAAFGGAGKELAIDGRPVDLPLVAPEEQGAPSGPAAATSQNPPRGPESSAQRAMLLGTVGSVGQLPGNLQLMHPVATRRISSPYGWRANPTGAGHQIHIGQDYPIACGSPVHASESGTVSVSRWAGHSGMRVTLDHGHNVQTGYSHNSKLLVAVGQRVQQGEVIALSGTTGNSTGCHVHFEVLVNGRWSDPRLYLPRIPGQGPALIDSTRLTVDARSAPKGQPERPSQKEQNPDVVVPKDNTPAVPEPAPDPTPKKTPAPSQSASSRPSASPTAKPTTKPTEKPSASPTAEPSKSPTSEPSPAPSKSPSPSPSPSEEPEPSESPSGSPTVVPSATPKPSESPSGSPTVVPSATPKPSKSPEPSTAPTAPQSPSNSPTPSIAPSASTKTTQSPEPSPDALLGPSATMPKLPESSAKVPPDLAESKEPSSPAQEKSTKPPEAEATGE
ncbi:peptidoglycan DD-metalloendopeptidase family protein [Glutamicibacter sp. AOP33-2CA-4]|uniref:peptidoglycan DD-metalloendopeptidase family protein n=1 Tax=Glutamicibacter sp. AOP33-2CA-4 TaxID=3457690 RepID=UPI00403362C4